MTTSTLDASMVRLEGIKENKHKYNKKKIAEAEALAAEALRMANEAKLAAARLAEVKKTLSLFSKKLENVERTVQKELTPKSVVTKQTTQKEAGVEEEANTVEEELAREESTAIEPTTEKPGTEESPTEESVEDESRESPEDVEDGDDESAEPVDEPAEKEDVTEDEEVIDDISSEKNAPIAVAKEESKPEPIEQISSPTLEPEATENHVDEPTVSEDVDEPESKETVSAVEQPTQTPAPTLVVEQSAQNPAPVTVAEIQGEVRTAPVSVAITPPVQHRVVPETFAIAQDYDKDVIEDLLDSLGIDKMCGVDDTTLGFVDRPVPPPPPPPPPPKPSPPFENPTRVELKNSVDPNDFVHSISLKEKIAATQRTERNLAPRTFQRAPVNSDFSDPFGVDHDDLVFCGKLADLCEPPEFDDDYYYDDVLPQQNFALQSEYNSRKSASFKSH